MITSMRGCVAYNDLWPWPISSRSFGLILENRVRSVASTVFDGFFPYLVQMITSMRRCVACDDNWPWPISSRSFDLDFENRVRAVTFSVLDRLFPYLAQIIISIRGCVTCNDLWPWPIFSRSFGLDFENRVRSVASTVLDGFFPYLVQMINSMRRCVACDDLWPWPISSRSFDLDFENRVWSGGYPRRWHRLIYLVYPVHGANLTLIQPMWSAYPYDLVFLIGLALGLYGIRIIFYPAALKGSGVLSYPERAGGWAAGQTSPVNTLTSILFHGSFSNLARTFITLRSRTSSIVEVLPH